MLLLYVDVRESTGSPAASPRKGASGWGERRKRPAGVKTREAGRQKLRSDESRIALLVILAQWSHPFPFRTRK